ncbi:MAG: 8-amino-7-oxononanoate synthase [Halomonadaceae bacterium]|nr:MAG: 8-amino-7-oxononanoate synthase [Halomonadaceae bacterium]
MPPIADWAAELATRERQGLLRRRRVLQSQQGPHVIIDGQHRLAFCSNDYLGLAAHPALTEALKGAADQWGVGSGASHLVCGHHQCHHDLEQALAAHTGREAALLFSSGYMANLGVIAALTGRGETILQDRLNHASLLDAARLSDARLVRYAHNDMGALKQRLESVDKPALVVTDGVFSMDGDLADLPAMAQLCQDHQVPLMVDDAHGIGVLGAQGGGVLSHFGLSPEQVPVLMGTLGKALGVYGAFIAGSQALIDYLVQKARPYIYTTALPPALAAATQVGLQLCRDESWRREQLTALVQRFRREAQGLGYELMPSATPIQPIMVGSAHEALRLSTALEEQGVLVTAIRPPTVPLGGARLRVTFSAAHTEAHLDQLLEALAKAREVVHGA